MSSPTTRVRFSQAWRDARDLVRQHRNRLLVGFALMLVNRAAGFVLPAAPKFVIDDAIGKHRPELLPLIALALGVATLIQAGTSFVLSQLLGVAAQRAITDMRKKVMAHVTRLPVRYFDSTQTGVLISRVMTDAEGVRNLVGTGLVQLASSLVTAAVALIWLFAISWQLTLLNLVFLAIFGAGMTIAFGTLRPLFRERGKINAEVTGRLGETLGGVRVVKAYTAERREQLVFARGAHRLFRNIARTMTGVSAIGAVAGVIAGGIGILMILVGGPAILGGRMTLGTFGTYVALTGMLAAPLVQLASIGTQISEAFAGLDRIREVLGTPTERDGQGAGSARRPARRHRVRARLVRIHPGRAGAEGRELHGARREPPPRSWARAARARARSSAWSWPSTSRSRAASSWTGATSRACAWRTTARGWAWCCRRTSSSTAPSPRTSPSRGRTPRRRRSARWRASPTATSSRSASPRATTPSWASAASGSRAGSASASPSRAPSSPTRAS